MEQNCPAGEMTSPGEERPAATIEQVREDMYRLMRVQQTLFIYVDTLAKTVLACLPESPADAKLQTMLKRRNADRLLKGGGRAMIGDAKLAMQDQTDREL